MTSKKYIQFAGNVSCKLFLIFLMLLQQQISAQIENIWALGDGEKVFRNDETHPDKMTILPGMEKPFTCYSLTTS